MQYCIRRITFFAKVCIYSLRLMMMLTMKITYDLSLCCGYYYGQPVEYYFTCLNPRLTGLIHNTTDWGGAI